MGKRNIQKGINEIQVQGIVHKLNTAFTWTGAGGIPHDTQEF